MFRKPKERIEPVIEGYDGLMESYERMIDTLEGRLNCAETKIETLDQRLQACEGRHLARDKADMSRDRDMADLRKLIELCGQKDQTTQNRIEELETKIA